MGTGWDKNGQPIGSLMRRRGLAPKQLMPWMVIPSPENGLY